MAERQFLRNFLYFQFLLGSFSHWSCMFFKEHTFVVFNTFYILLVISKKNSSARGRFFMNIETRKKENTAENNRKCIFYNTLIFFPNQKMHDTMLTFKNHGIISKKFFSLFLATNTVLNNGNDGLSVCSKFTEPL